MDFGTSFSMTATDHVNINATEGLTPEQLDSFNSYPFLPRVPSEGDERAPRELPAREPSSSLLFYQQALTSFSIYNR